MTDPAPPVDPGRQRYDRLMSEADELLRSGSFDAAVQHFAAAAELAREGGAAPEMATALHRAAVGRDRQQRLDEAAWFARQALAIDEQCFGPVHPAVARDLHSLGVVSARGGDAQEAAELLARSASISRRLQSSRELITTLMALGQALHRSGQAKGAVDAFGEAAQLSEQASGAQGMHTVRALLSLAAAHASSGEFGHAHVTWTDLTRRLAGRGTPPAGIAGALASAWKGLGDLAHGARADHDDAAWMYSFAELVAPEGHPAGAAASKALDALGRREAPPASPERFVIVAAPPGADRVDVAHPTGGRLTVPRGGFAGGVGECVTLAIRDGQVAILRVSPEDESA